MKLSWFNTSMYTQPIPSMYEYEQYKSMQDIREIELEIVDQTPTPRYVLRFEPLLYVLTFT